ncbi:hypothetical protein EMN47_18680 [Prolixibacteraceae bacterium JC049]|nr:hypothetical protein [Prolixibacteraceae bacterium JC049]
MKLPFNLSDKLSWFKGDRILWIVLIFLSIASLLIIYSATGSLAWRTRGGNTLYYVIKHLLFMGGGFAAMLVMINLIPVRIYSHWSPLFWLGGIALLGVGFGLALKNGGTGRTIDIGPIGFQPSEVAKLTTVMFVAKLLSINQKTKQLRKRAFWQIIIITGITCGIIFLSDFSTAAILGSAIFCMMIVGHIPFKFLIGTVGAGVIVLALLIATADHLPKKIGRIQTMKGRIERYIGGGSEDETKKEEGFSQNDFGQLAIYKGGVLGVGPGNSEVSNYMAAAYNDFIFAIFIEEYGIVGGIVLLMLYLIFLYRGGIIVKNCNRTFPAFLVVGLTFMFVGQAMINMGVATSLLPNTGQPLPWVSMGGTSSLFTAVGIGCILSVSAQNQKNKQAIALIEAKASDIPQEDEEL